MFPVVARGDAARYGWRDARFLWSERVHHYFTADEQDAVASGKKNHVVIYEVSEIRVLSVTVAPGEVEIPHHHQWPSVIVYDRPVKSENRDGKGNLLAPKQ